MIIELIVVGVAGLVGYREYKNGELDKTVESLDTRLKTIEAKFKVDVTKVESDAKSEVSKIEADIKADVKKIL